MAQLAQSTVPQMPLQISGTIALIGAGRMGSAMLNGWIGLGLDPAQINVIEPQPAEGILGLAQRGLRLNSADLQASADAVVLAVKPQTAAEALARLPALLGASTVVISIMAGRTLGFLTGLLPPGTAIIRAMPNLPAAIGRGITVAVPNPAVTRAHRVLADRLLGAMGGVEWIADESLMDAVTAVSARARLTFSCWSKASCRLEWRRGCRRTLRRGSLDKRSSARPNCSTVRQRVRPSCGKT